MDIVTYAAAKAAGAKAARQFDAADSGKAMVVGADGVIVAETIAAGEVVIDDTLAIEGAAADAAAVGAKAELLDDAVEYFDGKINLERRYIKYYPDYKTELEASGGTSSGASIGVVRYRSRVLLNYVGGSTYAKRVRITGDISRTSGNNTYKDWVGQLQLVEGRVYGVTVRRISGTAVDTDDNDYSVGVSVYESQGSSTITTEIVRTADEATFKFTAPAGKINIAIYLRGEVVVTNFLCSVELYEWYSQDHLFAASHTTAKSNISQGEYFCYNGTTLCRATAAIASGEACVIGTNCQEVGLETVLNLLTAAVSS